MPSASSVRPQSIVSATEGALRSSSPRSTRTVRTSASTSASGSSGTRLSTMRRSRSASGKSRCRNRQRRFSASDSSRVEFDVSTANGRRDARTVPISGTVTW